MDTIGKLGPYELNTIVTGDTRELSRLIPDDSIDLIFTDPPYPREYLPLFGWLAEEAARILKPGGRLLVMSGQSWLPEVYRLLTHPALYYHWTFCMDALGGSVTVWNRRIAASWKPIISYVKGKQYDGRMYGADRVPSQRDKRFHGWGQSTHSAAWFFSRHTPGIVFDPFCGGGATVGAAIECNWKYLAFEIDEESANISRARAAVTRPALPLAPVQQNNIFNILKE